MLSMKNCLLHDKYFRNPNLWQDINPYDRYYGDIHTGSWFLNAHNKICKTKHDVLLPIILFIDGTPIDTFGNLKLEAVMMTLGIFNQSKSKLCVSKKTVYNS